MFFIYFKTIRFFSIIEDSFVIDNDIRSFFEFDCDFFFEFDFCSFRVFDDEKRVECKKELKENAKLKIDEQFENKNELINKEFLTLLSEKRDDENRVFMTDEMY
jgi:hypothetical protein